MMVYCWFLQSFYSKQLVTVVVQFHTGCALMIIEVEVTSKLCYTLKKRRMYDTYSSSAYHS